MSSIINSFDPHQIQHISLINNAGTLGEIHTTANLKPDDMVKTVQLNTLAPLILSSTFLSLTQHWSCEKTIVNISSGAAAKPYSGWTVYCATKAALDMMTKTIAVEQEALQYGTKVLSIYPGVVDTDMQSKIRQCNRENFAAIDRFLDLKATHALADATTVGAQIYDIATQQTIENGTIIRIEA